MYKIYNKKLKYGKLNARLGLLHSSNVGIIIQITTSFTLMSKMFGKTIWLSEFRVTCSRYENKLFLQFFLQILNDQC